MPANYVLLGEITTSVTTAFVTFSKIPQTGYTDLKVVCSSRDDRSGQPNGDLTFQVGYNGTINTGSIYLMKRLGGNGSSAFSDGTNTTSLPFGMSTSTTASANTYGNSEFYIPNYTSSTSKSVSAEGVSENNATTAFAALNSGIISTNNPITDIKIFPFLASNFIAGSTFYLYGIAAVGTTPVIAPKAAGGDIVVNDGTYWYHAFLSSGIFTPSSNLSCDALVIAGGGGGGYTFNGGAGGGGAGGIFYATSQSLISTNYAVTIGAGGPQIYEGALSNGNDSQFGSLTLAKGGGQGGRQYGGGFPGASGGSGGGGGGAPGGSGNAGGTSTQTSTGGTGYGNAGGQGATGGGDQRGGGGGGAGAAGTVGNSNGAGGAGLNTWSSWASATGTGVSGFYAGGGGGNPSGAAGSGGGGTTGVAGIANTGSGGGGGANQGSGASGGSGIVIVRYTMA